jgi:hypothetical protein
MNTELIGGGSVFGANRTAMAAACPLPRSTLVKVFCALHRLSMMRTMARIRKINTLICALCRVY